MFKFFPTVRLISFTPSFIKGSGLFFGGYKHASIKGVKEVWDKIGPYVKPLPTSNSTKFNIKESDVEGLKFKHAFGPKRLENFSSIDEYMFKKAIPEGVEILEGSGGLGGKKTAFYTHVIGPDTYRYGDLFTVITEFFEPTNGKPAVVFLSKKDALPSTLQLGVGAPEATWEADYNLFITHAQIEPIIWHDGKSTPKFTVHSPELLAAWAKEIFISLDSAIEGVLEVANLLNIESSGKEIAELLNEIQIEVFKIVRLQSEKQHHSIINHNEEYAQDYTNNVLSGALSIVLSFEKILEDKKIRLVFPKNIYEILGSYQEKFKSGKTPTSTPGIS